MARPQAQSDFVMAARLEMLNDADFAPELAAARERRGSADSGRWSVPASEASTGQFSGGFFGR